MNDASSGKATMRVRKRDATIEPFEIAKLRNCLRAAMHGAADPAGLDNTAAGSLAEAIQEYLRVSTPRRVASAGHLAELAEVVLSQTGHDAAAMAFRQHAQLRDQQRKWLMVACPRPSDGRFVQQRWRKSRLVASLQQGHTLDRSTARMIAGRVEQLIFNCGLKVVTANLVREMANSELLAWGLLPGALVVKKTRKHQSGIVATDPIDPA